MHGLRWHIHHFNGGDNVWAGLLDDTLRPALGLPQVPLPVFEMCEAIDPQQRQRAVVLVPVVRVEVNPDDAVEVAQCRWGVERLSYPKA